eukprot:g11446.t1
MDASSNMHSCVYRSGYDVSLPLAPKKYYPDTAKIAPLDRAFFLTFKGTVYLTYHGSEERLSIVPLNDEEHRVVISVHCFEVHGAHLLPENLEYCQSLRDGYDDYDYSDLMETTFGLVPAGRSPGTYRLAEVMGAGAIPVIVARDYVPPFREDIDWPSFSFVFAPDQVGPNMMDVLRAVPQAQLEEMQVGAGGLVQPRTLRRADKSPLPALARESLGVSGTVVSEEPKHPYGGSRFGCVSCTTPR